MPITSNVGWDGRLEAFKGRDTTHFVKVAAATATACAACGLPLQPDELLSLSVDITQSRDGQGTEYLTFDTRICHRRCREPDLTLRQTGSAPDELKTLGARITLEYHRESGNTTIPVLAYTLSPVLTFREPGGELTSALVSVLLSHGFGLSMSTDYREIVQHTRDVKPGIDCTITEQGLVSLHISGELMYSEQLNPADAGDAEWLEAALRGGKVLVISGDYLQITDTGLHMDAAARLGTLATGNVPVLT